MKKVLVSILVVMLTLLMFACGNEEVAEPNADASSTGNLFSQYLDKGYVTNEGSFIDNTLEVLFENEDKTDFVVLSVLLSKEELKEYDKIDFFSETYDMDIEKFYRSVSSKITERSLTDRIPKREDIDKFVGLTIGELEELGYEQSSMGTGDDGSLTMIYSDLDFNYEVYFKDRVEDLFSLSDMDLKNLEIGRVEFYGFNNY